jgi:hypothetical protein
VGEQNAEVKGGVPPSARLCCWDFLSSGSVCAASLAAVTGRVGVPTMGDFPFAHLA